MATKKKEVMQLGEMGLGAKRKKLKKSKIDVGTIEDGVNKIHPETEEPTVRISGKFKKSVYVAMKKKLLDRGETVTDYINRLVEEDLGI